MTIETVLIAGPTASGKSAAALALARATGGAIVNADSMQVYRELAILSARPGVDDLAAAEHRLYGHVSAREPYSVARWLGDVASELEAHRAEGRLAIIVGGTGLYFRALEQGLSPIPPIPAAVRDGVRARGKAEGAEALFAALTALDPESAQRLHPGDMQRVLRALEVIEATGTPLGEWQRLKGEGVVRPGATCRLLLLPEREALYRRCDERFGAMIAAGALNEAAAIRALCLDARLPATKALGLPPLLAHLDGALALGEAIAVAQRDTRRYAKRQMTWFRHQMADWPVFSAGEALVAHGLDAVQPSD